MEIFTSIETKVIDLVSYITDLTCDAGNWLSKIREIKSTLFLIFQIKWETKNLEII